MLASGLSTLPRAITWRGWPAHRALTAAGSSSAAHARRRSISVSPPPHFKYMLRGGDLSAVMQLHPYPEPVPLVFGVQAEGGEWSVGLGMEAPRSSHRPRLSNATAARLANALTNGIKSDGKRMIRPVAGPRSLTPVPVATRTGKRITPAVRLFLGATPWAAQGAERPVRVWMDQVGGLGAEITQARNKCTKLVRICGNRLEIFSFFKIF